MLHNQPQPRSLIDNSHAEVPHFHHAYFTTLTSPKLPLLEKDEDAISNKPDNDIDNKPNTVQSYFDRYNDDDDEDEDETISDDDDDETISDNDNDETNHDNDNDNNIKPDNDNDNDEDATNNALKTNENSLIFDRFVSKRQHDSITNSISNTNDQELDLLLPPPMKNRKTINSGSSLSSSLTAISPKQTYNETAMILNGEDGNLPILKDKSLYKQIALIYYIKMNWDKPIEITRQQTENGGFDAEVIFGSTINKQKAFGYGMKKKEAIYNAYSKLIPMVIPHEEILNLKLIKQFIPKHMETGKSNTINISKHPKTALIEWSIQNNKKPPKTEYTISNVTNNTIIWNARVTFCGETVEAEDTRKKDAERKCCKILLQHIY